MGRKFWFSTFDIFARAALWARWGFWGWQITHQPYRWVGGHSSVRDVQAHI